MSGLKFWNDVNKTGDKNYGIFFVDEHLLNHLSNQDIC